MKTFDNRRKDKTVWAIAHNGYDIFHISLLGKKEMITTGLPYLDVYTPDNEDFEKRLDIIIELYAAAQDSKLSIPISQFVKDNLGDIISYISIDDKKIVDAFEKGSDEWLDAKASEKERSPREYASELFSGTKKENDEKPKEEPSEEPKDKPKKK